MNINIIVAESNNHVIGNKGGIPWQMKDDQEFFRKITMGHTVCMGRKTHDSIGRVLPGRVNHVLTSDRQYKTRARKFFKLRHSMANARKLGETEYFIIGGASLYEKALPLCTSVYRTTVNCFVPGDTFFPELVDNQWDRHILEVLFAGNGNDHSGIIERLDAKG